MWQKKGWLKGRRSGGSRSKKKLWCFIEKDIAECLRQRPWLVLLKPTRQWLISDYSHHFFYIVRDEWERDPWYTGPQARALLGIGNSTLYKYIRQGLLQAEKSAYLAPSHKWGVIVRGSAVQSFLKQLRALHSFLENEPMLQKESAASMAMKTNRITSGHPVMLSKNWLLECPSCNEKVQIAAQPELSGLQVRKQFLTVYVNGKCIHGSTCLL